jgi:hypothetical protein
VFVRVVTDTRQPADGRALIDRNSDPSITRSILGTKVIAQLLPSRRLTGRSGTIAPLSDGAHAVGAALRPPSWPAYHPHIQHADLDITPVNLRGIDNTEIAHAVHERPAPSPATRGL